MVASVLGLEEDYLLLLAFNRLIDTGLQISIAFTGEKSQVSLGVTTYALALSCIYPAEDRAHAICRKLDLSFRFPTVRKCDFFPVIRTYSRVAKY